MSHLRWELAPLGNIPHEVLSILLGSLPKVPDPRQEEEALGRSYETHDDRLSDDDEDEEARRASPLIQDQSAPPHAGVNTNISGSNQGEKSPSENAEEDDVQRSWNVPDDEWEWSDEEPAGSSSSTSRAARHTYSSISGATRQGSTLTVPAKNPRETPTRLGLLGTAGQGDKASSSSGSTSSIASAPSSPSSNRPQAAKVNEHARTHSSHPLTVAQDLCISICDSGRYIACASKKMFAILQRQTPFSGARSPEPGLDMTQNPPKPGCEWVLIGQGSGVDSQLQIYVVVGYKSGMIRIFDESGHLVVVQQLHHTPVMSIKARIGLGKVPGEDEDEMVILHEGGKVVCIEGENNKSVQASQAPTFAYKKWSLQNQDLLVDVVSCGPARHRPTLSNGFSSSSSSSMFTSQATERFVSVGSKPMMTFYASSSSSRPLFSATSLATQMAARVTNAVFGFAKSIWGSSPSPRPGSPALGAASGRSTPEMKRPSGLGPQDGTAGPYGSIYPSAMAPATEVPAVLWLSDSQRCIRHLSLAPSPPRGSCYHYPSKLAAMTDSLGRVLLVDLEECEIIRMWKGLRGARCSWVQEERELKAGKTTKGGASKRYLVLYLVIYAPKRGTVEIYPARQGKRVGLLQVGLGWKICTTFTSPIGKPVLLDRVVETSRPSSTTREPDNLGPHSRQSLAPLGLSQCLLIGPTGEVRQVVSKPMDLSSATLPALSNSLTVAPATSDKVTDSIVNRLQSLSAS
ncbi:Rab3 GTPase-activating protein non-catalytic subunit [Mortierella claussenii]|nr:Rab3 GTPase-activating protein non-catalytic subunit [Mortierella claussenii]